MRICSDPSGAATFGRTGASESGASQRAAFGCAAAVLPNPVSLSGDDSAVRYTAQRTRACFEKEALK